MANKPPLYDMFNPARGLGDWLIYRSLFSKRIDAYHKERCAEIREQEKRREEERNAERGRNNE